MIADEAFVARLPAVPATERSSQRGHRRANRLRAELGEELRLARTAAGLTQAEVARRSGLSAAAVGRLERGELESPGVTELCVALAVCGYELSARAYPIASPDRTRGHAECLRRFHGYLPLTAPWWTEVTFP